MRAFNLFCSGAVLLCAVVLSYHHSVELMAAGGYQGVYRHLAVILAELTFLAGAANVVLARIQKRSPGVPPVLGALFGVVLTGWANISAGLEYGMTGILLGAMVPLALVISEAILAHFLLNGTTNNEANNATTSATGGDANTSGAVTATTGETDSATNTPNDTNTSETSTSEADTSTKDTRTTTRTNTSARTNNPGSANRTKRTSRTDGVVDYEIERVKKKALQIMEEEGKLPGRPRLVKETGCRENVARRALAELKQQRKNAG